MVLGRKKYKPIVIPKKPVVDWKYTTCNYCSTGCSIETGLDENGRVITSRGDARAVVNRGKLCIKGILEHDLFESPCRVTQPLVRKRFQDAFKPAGWDDALDVVQIKSRTFSGR